MREILCRHCLMTERDHPSARCSNFEPRTTRKRKRSAEPSTPPPAGADPYVVATVRTLLAQTLHYVADCLAVDASIITRAPAVRGVLAEALATSARAAPATDERSSARPAPATHATNGARAPSDPLAVALIGASLAKGQRDVLTALAQAPHRTLTLAALTTTTGRKRSTRNRLLQELAALGFVSKHGQQVTATAVGVRALGESYKPLPTGDELRGYWLDRLPAGNAEVLRVVCAAYPAWLDRERISEQTEHSRSTRNRLIQELAARKLVDTRTGYVRASDLLFSRPQPLTIGGAS